MTQIMIDYLRNEVSRLSSQISQSNVTDYGGIVLYGANMPADSTSGGVFKENLSLTYANDERAGNYAIEWNFTANSSAVAAKINARVQHNNTDTIWSVRTPPISAVANDRMSFSGFAHLALSVGVHTFDLDFRNVGTGTITLSQSRMRLVKIRDT